ncbi:putative retrovirus poly protein [Lipomyces kononenkoae]
MGQVNRINIDLDTCAQIDCVSAKWAEQMELKPYKKRYPELIRAAGALSAEARGAYWARFTMRDDCGVVREHYQPFLAIDRDSDDAELLLSHGTLQELGISLSLADQKTTWQYQLHRSRKPFIRSDNKKRFRKRLTKSPHVFALVMINPLIQDTVIQNNQLPSHLQDRFSDVFSTVRAERLAPNREETDLGIEIQDGKQPPYGPLYPLSPAELEALREYLGSPSNRVMPSYLGFLSLLSRDPGSPETTLRLVLASHKVSHTSKYCSGRASS